MTTGILIGLLVAAILFLGVIFVVQVVSRQKFVRTLDEIESFLDMKRPGVTTGKTGPAEFIMPDRVKEITKARPGVSIDEVLT